MANYLTRALLLLSGLLLSAQTGLAAPAFEPAASAIESVSFWGQPFPYGYTGWGPCIRYERLETERGTIIRRRVICNPAEYRRRRSI